MEYEVKIFFQWRAHGVMGNLVPYLTSKPAVFPSPKWAKACRAFLLFPYLSKCK